MWSDGLYDDSVADMLDELSQVEKDQYSSISELEAEAVAELSLIEDRSYPSELDAEADSELSLIF